MAAIQLIPSARRLIKSLRDMGYDFAQAVADVVDNSIEAKATVVSIDIEFDGDNSWLRIADNGRGMRAEELQEALRYGAEREYAGDDLGKFGLGLKTASMSQCQRLSVASRRGSNQADAIAYSWDLDHIEKTNRWEILPVKRARKTANVFGPLNATSGTVVLWQRLDRILGYQHPYGEAARKRLSQMCREIEAHLGMVFHRFLTEKSRGRTLKILVNGNPVPPWDPFCISEDATTKLKSFTLDVSQQGVAGSVVFEPYILPHQDDFSSPDAFRRASGPANWNQQQGFYIYRAGRLIQSGGWSNLRAPDEHTKLARVAVRFSPLLDEAFKINVAKMRVQLPSSIRETVRDAMVPFVKLARERYDRKDKNKPTAPKPTPMPPIQVKPTGEWPMPEPNGGYVRPASSEALRSFSEWKALTLREATSDERPFVVAVISRLQT